MSPPPSPQNLPLSYNFAYVIAVAETTVLASSQLSSTAPGIRLPQGDPSDDDIVYVVTYVTNAFGSVARCSTGVDGTGPVNVTSAPLPSANLVEYVLNESTPLLSNYQAQSDNSAALGSVIVFSSLLSSSSSSCYHITCDSSSVCSNGVCIASTQGTCARALYCCVCMLQPSVCRSVLPLP